MKVTRVVGLNGFFAFLLAGAPALAQPEPTTAQAEETAESVPVVEAAEAEAPADNPTQPVVTPSATVAPVVSADVPSVDLAAPLAEAEEASPRSLDANASYFKPGTGLVLQSEDGQFAIAPRLRAQFLHTFQDDASVDATQSVEIRRARLQFKGHLYGKNNEFKVELAFSPGDTSLRDGGPVGTSPLLDWYMEFTHYRDVTLRVGQYKVSHNPQRVISSGDLQLVDRSIVNGEFNLDRDLGFDLRSDDLGGLGLLRYYAGVYGGEGRNTRGAYDLGLMALARLELLPFGMFDDYKEGDLKRSDKPLLRLGIGYARLENARGNRGILGRAPSDGGTTDINSLTADAVFKMSGFSATVEGMMRQGTRTAGDATAVDEATGVEGLAAVEAPRDGLGAMVQAGYVLPGVDLEFAARVGLIRPMGDDTSLSASDEYGGGVSYYFADHPFKLQADYFRLGEEAADGSTNFENRVRVQLQASF